MKILFDELKVGQTIFQFWSDSLYIYFIDVKTDNQVKVRTFMIDINANKMYSFNNGNPSKEDWDDTINIDSNLYWDDKIRRHQAIWAIFEGRWT